MCKFKLFGWMKLEICQNEFQHVSQSSSLRFDSGWVKKN